LEEGAIRILRGEQRFCAAPKNLAQQISCRTWLCRSFRVSRFSEMTLLSNATAQKSQ
jgi:hypothetical protein